MYDQLTWIMHIMKVSTADFIKNYGTLADKALTEPLTITKNGRDRFVLVEAAEFARLMRRDRKVKRLVDFTTEEMNLVLNSEMPEGYEHLDAELAGWKP
jgi:Antitoxin Phd_YefM, type II toxin-antitoxin system